jgi:hypothetical protein
MIKDIIDLDSRNIDMIQDAEKAALLLGDLLQTYSLGGEHPTKEESKKILYDSGKILKFIDIACDYVCEIKRELNRFALDLNILLDKAKQADGQLENIVKAKKIDEQFNTVFINMIAASHVNDGKTMASDFKQFVYARCDKALLEDEEFKKIGYDDKVDPEVVLAKAETICYEQGFRDAVRMLLDKI